MIATVLASSAFPAGVAQTTLLDLTVQNPLASDFDAGADDWTSSEVPPPPTRPDPANPSWERGSISRGLLNPSWEWGAFETPTRPAPAASTWQWGAPTSGPGVAFSGSNVWATNLAGNYNNNECGAIVSPAITIPAGSTASFSVMQWRHIERSTSTTLFDGGRLFVSADGGATLTAITSPTPAYDAGTLSTVSAACLNGMATTGGGAYSGPAGTTPPAPTYSAIGASLSAFAGQTVQVFLAFASEGSVNRSGWYIDDFAVTIDGVTTTEDFESGDGGFTIKSTALPPANGPGVARSGSNVWGTNLAGHYNNNECSAIMSPPIAIPAGSTASASFWQWRHFQRATATGTISDGGRLFVTADDGGTLGNVTAPSPAYDAGTLSTVTAACFGFGTVGSGAYAGPAGTALPGANYSQVSANLNAYAGQTVRLVVAFASDASTAQSGWYIDDFGVTIDGVTTTEDFEASNGGFSVIGVKPSGPGVARSGSNVWATNLDGDYNTNECAALLSPPIAIPDDATATASFWQWHHFERSSATGTIFDGGRLFATLDGGESFINIDAPTPAYDTGTISTTIATCFNGLPTTGVGAYGGPVGTVPPATGYSEISADLSSFAGGSVQFVIAFGSESGGERGGWYVDDFTVTINGTSSVEDFESGTGGFTVITTAVPPAVAKGWSHGVPTTGPGGLSPEDQMWATNLNGNHGPNECHWIESPPVDLGPLPPEAAELATVTLSWEQWIRTSSSTAAGVVQIGTGDGNYTIIEPANGYPASPTSTVLDACLHHLAPELGAFAGTTDAVGAPMTEYEADLSAYLGQTITVRFLFASTSSTSTNPGWYVDDVNVEVSVVVTAPDSEDLPVPGLGGADAPGWTQGGPISTWGFGVTSTNPANQTAYKTNLNGNHDANECSYIESPAVPGALLAGAPMLSFEHWHRIPGTSVNVPWGAGIVLVSDDGGATWSHVAMPDYNKAVYEPPTYTEIFDNCLSAWGADSAGGGYGKASTSVDGNVDGWYTSSVDLSSHASSPTVKIRFAYASDGSFAYEGWAIRSVTMGGVKLL